ncbi:MAG: hypothetical protein ACRDWW_03020 [Acidimicrobiales bacterium]
MAGIHFDLYAAHGYNHIPTIGSLFLFNGAVGVALGLALLATPGRLVVLPALATAVFLAGTIGGLALSVNVGLFGFTETSRAPLFDPALAVEAAGIVVGLALAATALAPRRRRNGPGPLRRRRPNSVH